ncbi:DinB family protein [Shimazuella kribbensis]|uniref:DinB family protein n=1 Tax=Shimazuella kribbensis TaxID=139808 RepID=UPI00040E2718|nr:DinB family protein [Shimazuella kribbensis]
MNNKNMLLEQWTACFDQNNWFVSLKHALEGLTEEQASWKSGEMTNSIWELVNHLNFYNERYYYRFQGKKIEDISHDYNTFETVEGLGWQETAEKCLQILSDWRVELEKADPEKLNSKENLDYEWVLALSNMTIHHAYHIGQIVHIRKQQEAWSAEQGVKG